MNLKRTLAAGALVLMSAAGAQAADLPMAPMAPPPPPPAPMAPAFDWSGPYVGFYGGYAVGPGWIQAGVQAGINVVRNRFVAGAEVQAGAIYAGAFGFEANLNGRLGFALGSRVLLYGEAGVGVALPPAAYLWTAGGGLEFGLNSGASVFTEAKMIGAFGGGTVGYTIQAGVNFRR